MLVILGAGHSAALSTHLDVNLPPLPSGHHLRLTEGLSLLEGRTSALKPDEMPSMDRTVPGDTYGRSSKTQSGLIVIDDSVPGEAGDLLSVGGTVWPCAAALCRWLRSEAVSHSFAGASVLEIGAGTGACGLYAAGLGSARVHLTDGRVGLGELLSHNIKRNAHELSLVGSAVTSGLHRWGEDPAPKGPWDWVIGSDITYHNADATMDALASTLGTLLDTSRPPRVVIAHDHRLREAMESAGTSWDVGDDNLSRFAAAVEGRGLVLEQLAWERPTREERAIGCHEVSIIEVSAPPPG